MIYREYGRGNEKISEIGYGGEHIEGLPENEVIPVIERVIESGINIIDIFMSNPEVRTYIGNALGSKRKDVFIQGHLGATWQNNQYERSRNLDDVKTAFEDLLTRLNTDYIDFGLLHFIDSDEDYNGVFDNGNFTYAQELQKLGVIKRIGFSSHNPIISQKLIDTGYFDMYMFSINPGFDMDPISKSDIDTLFTFNGAKSSTAAIDPVRQALYNSSEAKGIGITVMKTLGAGHLLDAESSPFGESMSVGQCIKYALDRPAVVSVLLGCKTVEEVDEVMAYYSLSEEQKDYSNVISNALANTYGKCMYCNHCLPCPASIDIAAVNKYYDLALTQDTVPATVKGHYLSLSSHASDCISCGSCLSNCPFSVDVITRMQQAEKLFGV